MSIKAINDIKKKLLAKKIQSYEAIFELKKIVDSTVIGMGEMKNEVADGFDKVDQSIRGIKHPDMNGLIKKVGEIKPVVNFKTDEIVDLLKLILEKKPVEVTKTDVKWPKDPKDAIPVVLTDKFKKDFYNAISALPMFSGGGGGSINTTNLATKDLQEAMITAIENIEINADSINLNTDDLESLLTAIQLLLQGTLKVEEQNPLDLSPLATAAKQLPDGHEVEVNNFPTTYPLPASQVTTLTPPGAITGFSTSSNQTNGDQKTQLVPLNTWLSTAVTLTTLNTAYKLPSSEQTDRKLIVIYNISDTSVYIGGSTVTTTTGILLPAGGVMSLDASANVYAICGTSGKILNVLESK